MHNIDALERLFSAALDKQPHERLLYLDDACHGDAPLRDRLEKMLAAHAEASRFLEAPHSAIVFDSRDLTQEFRPLSEGPGTKIGPYKLLQQIGEGGFGVVYMAEQERPVRRKVALKIIKPGMDTKEIIARFESERQALALMDHPNIAKVLDAGATESGRPYFVMELVKGIPITDFCDDNHLALEDRLQLFIQICHAVQHAHQKGIIHRDLKPSNVMVTLHDGRPVPKLLDFGVAKATSQQLTEKTLFTAYGQMIGTPAYMSPEQAELSGLDIDTRADIYSLGVLLYELLTGTTPFDSKTLRAAGFDEMRRIIREVEPETVSTRLARTRKTGARDSGLGTQGSELEKRPTTPNPEPRVPRLSELDWIVSRSLDKDRERRYESASSFAADVQRYLKDEPVLACPPSTLYRFRKFAHKHKTAFTTAAALAATLLICTAVSAWQAVEANRARQVADNHFSSEQKARREAEQARRDAEAQRDRANRERDRAERERQRAESERLRAESERERVESERRRANRNFESALEATDRLLSKFAEDVEGIPFLPPDFQQRLAKDALDLYERLLADSDNDPEVRHAYAKVRLRFYAPVGDPDTYEERRYAEPIAILEELVASEPSNMKYLQSLADGYFGAGAHQRRFAKSPDRQKALEFHRRSADLFGKLADAGVKETELLRSWRKFRDMEAQSWGSVASLLHSMGRTAEADRAYGEFVKAVEKNDDPLSSSRSSHFLHRARQLLLTSPDESDDFSRRAVAISRQRITEGIDISGWNKDQFTKMLRDFAARVKSRHPEEAEALLDEAITVARQIAIGIGQKNFRASLCETILKQAELLLGQIPDSARDETANKARLEKAETLLAEGIVVARTLADEAPDNADYKSRLITLERLDAQHFGRISSLQADIAKATRLGRHDVAEAVARKLVAKCEEQLGKDHPATMEAVNELAWTLYRQRKFLAAESYCRQYATWSEKEFPKWWGTSNRVSVLCSFISGAAGELKVTDPAAANAKLLEAYELLLRSSRELILRENDIPQYWKVCVTQSLQSLVHLHLKIDKPDETGNWSDAADARKLQVAALLTEAIQLYHGRTAEFPDDPQYKSRLAALEKLHTEHFNQRATETKP
ncbi:MAG TPA: serine/threonine-protein kinase [Pirellulaceae bacterium]